MTYRLHRSHIRYAPVAAQRTAPRRRPQRLAVMAPSPFAAPARPAVLAGLVYGLPLSLLLWMAMALIARALL